MEAVYVQEEGKTTKGKLKQKHGKKNYNKLQEGFCDTN